MTAIARYKGHENIFAIGDVAYMEEPAWPNGHPQVAPVAMQMADMIAKNLRNIEMKSNNAALEEFVYNDKGAMATVGRNLAVVDMPKPKLHFGGFFRMDDLDGFAPDADTGCKNRFCILQLAI